MELREAIENLKQDGDEWLSYRRGDRRRAQPSTIATILNAVADGTMIPADACLNVDDGVLYQAMNDGYGRYGDFKRDVLMALTIRSADDVRREAYLKGVADGKDQAAEKAILDLIIDTPQPKGGDDV